MNTLNDYKNLIETRLGFIDILKIENDRLIPSEKITKEFIKNTHSDDLFDLFSGKAFFSYRFMKIVGEITDNKLKTGYQFLEIRK